MMARAIAKAAPKRISANAVTGGGFAVVSGLLIYGAHVVMPEMQKRMDENNKVFMQELMSAQQRFTTGLEAQGNRAVAIINEQSKQFSTELKEQRASDERRTERLTASMDALRAAIERKKE